MKLLMLFALFACSPLAWGLTPSRVQIAAEPMNRVVRPDTPANQRLLTAIEAGDLPGVQAALQSGASADAEAGWDIPAMDVPPLPAQPFGNPESFTVLATDSLLRGHDQYLPIFRLLLRSEPASSLTNPRKSVVLMCSAVGINDLDSVRWLVARGVSINPSPFDGDILELALDSSGGFRVKTVSPLIAFLLDHGADVNALDAESGTPLLRAAESGKRSVVQALLAHGADPALRDKHGWTALDRASQMGHDDVVALLRNRSPMNIYEAAQFGDVPRLKAHLDAGEDPNAADPSGTTPFTMGTTPLMKAAQAGSLATTRLLLDRGADIKRQRPDGTTALHLAALYGYASVAALLLDRGADINAAASKWGRHFTPLTYAVEQVQADVVVLLLKRGADLSHGQGEAALDTTLAQAGTTRLPYLVSKRRSRKLSEDAVLDARGQIIDSLLGVGVGLHSKSSHALFLAASGGQSGIVEELLDKEAYVDGRGEFIPDSSLGNSNGETALMGAIEAWVEVPAQEKQVKLTSLEQYANRSVLLLLTHGADVNLPDAHGTTPLMLCALYELPTLATTLLAHGADIDPVNPAGETALMQAAGKGRYRVAALFLAHHASLNGRDKFGRTPLMLAVDNGANDERRRQFSHNNEAFSYNPSFKPRPVPQKDLPNPDGHPETVRLLLLHGASVNAVAMNGATALSLARKENFAQVMALLLAAGARR